MRINTPGNRSFPSPYDVEFSETSLSLTQGTDDDLKHLRRFALLESLELRGTKFTDQVLLELRQLPALKTLVLSFPHLTSAGLKEVAELKHLEELTIIGGRAIDDEILGSLSNLKSLRSLKLEHTEITGTGLGHLAALPQLENLALRGSALTDDGLTHLRDLTQIRSLNLSGDQLSDKAIEPLENLTALEQLSIARYVPPSGNVGHPQRAQIARDGMPFQRGLQQLRSLSLEGLDITDEALRSISQLKSLQKLKCSSGFSDGPELQELDNLCRLPELRELAIYLNNIAPGGLAKLKGCRSLETLHVSCPSDTHLLALSTLTQIKELNVSGEFTNKGLAGVAGLTGLKRLNLYGNYTDAGVEHLKELVLLEELALGADYRQSRRLTDDCLPNLLGLKHLLRLTFERTKVTDIGVRKLKQSLSPKLSISRR